jgi:hypothetical protein
MSVFRMVLCLAGLGVYLLARQSTQSPLGTASRLPHLASPISCSPSSGSMPPDSSVPKSMAPNPSAPRLLQPKPDAAPIPTYGAPETEPHTLLLPDSTEWVKATTPRR